MDKDENVINFDDYKNNFKMDIDRAETIKILHEIIETLFEYGYDVSQNPRVIKELIFLTDLIDSIKSKLSQSEYALELSDIIDDSIDLTDAECQDLMNVLMGKK